MGQIYTNLLGRRPISAEAIELIRKNSRLEVVAAEYVRLRPAGKELIGLCPLHSERTPSFAVNPDKQVFHCQGCHEGGDIYTFVQKVKHVTFRDAVAILAPNAGVTNLGTFKPTLEQIAAEARRTAEARARAAYESFASDWIESVYTDARMLGQACRRAELALKAGGLTQEQDGWCWDRMKQFFEFEYRVDRDGICSSDAIRAEWGRMHGAL